MQSIVCLLQGLLWLQLTAVLQCSPYAAIQVLHSTCRARLLTSQPDSRPRGLPLGAITTGVLACVLLLKNSLHTQSVSEGAHVPATPTFFVQEV